MCQPRIPELAISARSFSSVVLLPRDLMALMFADRAVEVERKPFSEDMALDGFRWRGQIANSKRDEPNPLLWQGVADNVVVE